MNYRPRLLRQSSKVVWMAPSWKEQRKGREAEWARIIQCSLLCRGPNRLHTSFSLIPSLCSLFSVFPLSIRVAAVGDCSGRSGPGPTACQPVSQQGLSECQQQLTPSSQRGLESWLAFVVISFILPRLCLLRLSPSHCHNTAPLSRSPFCSSLPS